MLLNNCRRRQVAMIVLIIGMMMLQGSLHISSALASEPEHISLNYKTITFRDSSGSVRSGYLTAELDFNLDNNQVTGRAKLDLDGKSSEIRYTRIYEIEAGVDSRTLELRGTSNGVPVMTTLTISPTGIVVIAILAL